MLDQFVAEFKSRVFPHSVYNSLHIQKLILCLCVVQLLLPMLCRLLSIKHTFMYYYYYIVPYYYIITYLQTI